MVASLIFGRGFGLKKMNKIIEIYPDILQNNITYEMIKDIDGFSDKTSKQFIDNLDLFKTFIMELNFLEIKMPEKKKGSKFSGKKIVITGFRDKNITDYIEDNGGIVGNSISKNTDILVIKDKSFTSSKVSAAEMLGIPIITKEKFSLNF